MRTHDVFISYSHRGDQDTARHIERCLKRFARPWTQRRALDVFRDQSNLGAAGTLEGAIGEALDQSRFLVVVVSEDAAKSYWMSKEAERFLQSHDAARVILVFASGRLAWDAAAARFSEDSTIPEGLRSAFAHEPLWVDVRSPTALDPDSRHFQEAIATIAAPIHGRPKDELIGDDLREHKKLRRARRAAISALIVLLTVSLATATAALAFRSESKTAQQQRTEAEAERAVAEEAADQARVEQVVAERARDDATREQKAAEAARNEAAAELDDVEAERRQVSAELVTANEERSQAIVERDEIQLAAAEAEVARDEAESEANEARLELDGVRADLVEERNELLQTREDLAKAEDDLTNTRSDLQATESELKAALEDLGTVECANEVIAGRIEFLVASFNEQSDVEERIRDIETELSRPLVIDRSALRALVGELRSAIVSAVGEVERASFMDQFRPEICAFIAPDGDVVAP